MQKKGLKDHDCLDTSGVLDLALEYLDGEYKEVREGVYINFSKNAVVRMSMYDLTGHRGRCEGHVNFETLAGKKGPKYHIRYKD